MVRRACRGSLAVAVVAVLAAAFGSGAAAAEGRPATVAGQAKGRAEAFSVKFQVSGSFAEGGVALGLIQGVTLTDSRDDVGSAEGRVLDYGLIDALNRLPDAQCPNIIPLFNPDTLPPVTRVDSDQPGAQDSRVTAVRTAGFPDFGPEVGQQDAVAGPGAAAVGTARIPLVDGGFLSARDLVSEVRSSVDPRGSREVVSTVTASRLDLMGGMVTFLSPRFEARSASGSTGSGGFSFEAASILGNWMSFADAQRDLPSFTAFIEGVLAFVGFKIDWPTVEVVADPNPGGGATYSERVRVTPLRVRLSNMPIGRDLLRPVLQAFGPQIDEVIDNYLADPCTNQGLRLILDVARDFASGVGEIGVSFGGVNAETNDRWVEVTSLSTASPATITPPPTTQPVVEPEPSPTRRVVSTPTPVAVVVPTAPPTTAPPVVAGNEVARAAPPVRAPVSFTSSTRTEPGSKGGPATWVGLGVMGAIAGLMLGDRFVMRRSRGAAPA